MIQPEKLRTGNYIRTDPRSESNYYQVLRVDETIGSVSAQHISINAAAKNGAKENINLNCCFPIDITIEILNKSGFTETAPYNFQKEDLHLQFKRYGETFLSLHGKDETIPVTGINELQNAYHSITGKELEIKLS